MGRVKSLLIVGGVFILTAIILRISGVSGILPVVLFSLGGLLKAIYLIIGIRSGRFKIGAEIVLLPIGVSLVLTGVFVKGSPELKHMYGWLIASGVLLKSTFLFLFFRRQRKQVI
ncbi:hypothetical protein [Carboxylicivirga sp. N1Y90]|uniref:hypothetical protein n=1 Tax=Carboxylicivirga fragile TaxID=3417571 RepID=UPI003D332716|nr:hypothetical protein [Marinilabiliaceae bacterium N1Y90]